MLNGKRTRAETTQMLNPEYQYTVYLTKSKQDEEKMNPVQRRETRRAFMAGMAQTLLICRDLIPQMSVSEGANAMERLLKQVIQYWNEEQKFGA